MIHHQPDDRPDPRATFPPSPPADPPRKNFNDDFRLEIFEGVDGQWYKRLVSVHNGNTVLDEGYHNKGDLVDLLERAFPEATIHEVADPAHFTVEDFDPADAAPPGDPEKDCTGEPDAP